MVGVRDSGTDRGRLAPVRGRLRLPLTRATPAPISWGATRRPARLPARDTHRRRRRSHQVGGEARQPADETATRTDLLARRDTPIARGRGAATRNQLPAAGLGQPPRPAAELRDAHRQALGLQRQERGRDEPDAAPPWLGTAPGDRDGTDRLGVVGVLGVAQRRQDRSLLNRHQVRDCNGRSRRRLLPPALARGPASANGPRRSTCPEPRQPDATGCGRGLVAAWWSVCPVVSGGRDRRLRACRALRGKARSRSPRRSGATRRRGRGVESRPPRGRGSRAAAIRPRP